jgi:hypothetical protein
VTSPLLLSRLPLLVRLLTVSSSFPLQLEFVSHGMVLCAANADRSVVEVSG